MPAALCSFSCTSAYSTDHRGDRRRRRTRTAASTCASRRRRWARNASRNGSGRRDRRAVRRPQRCVVAAHHLAQRVEVGAHVAVGRRTTVVLQPMMWSPVNSALLLVEGVAHVVASVAGCVHGAHRPPGARSPQPRRRRRRRRARRPRSMRLLHRHGVLVRPRHQSLVVIGLVGRRRPNSTGADAARTRWSAHPCRSRSQAASGE